MFADLRPQPSHNAARAGAAADAVESLSFERYPNFRTHARRRTSERRIVAPRRARPKPKLNIRLIRRRRRPPRQITDPTRSRLMSAFVSRVGFPAGSPCGYDQTVWDRMGRLVT